MLQKYIPLTNYTTIEYAINDPCMVTIEILNMLGQPVRTLINSSHNRGKYHVIWDIHHDSGKKVPEGIYFCRILINHEFSNVWKLMLINSN